MLFVTFRYFLLLSVTFRYFSLHLFNTTLYLVQKVFRLRTKRYYVPRHGWPLRGTGSITRTLLLNDLKIPVRTAQISMATHQYQSANVGAAHASKVLSASAPQTVPHTTRAASGSLCRLPCRRGGNQEKPRPLRSGGGSCGVIRSLVAV